MQRWAYVWVTAATLLPVAVLATVALRWLRPSRSWRDSIAEVGMIFGTLPWVWMILTPVEVPPETTMVHLVPLTDIVALVRGGQAVTQIGGNLGVLFALGVFAPVRWRALAGFGRLFLLGAACSLGLETLQRVLATGRVFSVDDVLLNALGCVLGGLISRYWWASARRG